MFVQRRNRNLVQAAFTTLALIYHQTVHTLRQLTAHDVPVEVHEAWVWEQWSRYLEPAAKRLRPLLVAAAVAGAAAVSTVALEALFGWAGLGLVVVAFFADRLAGAVLRARVRRRTCRWEPSARVSR